MREPETSKGQNTSVGNSEVAAFANYVRLALSKFNPGKFRRAKKCVGDIMFQIEESDELEATSLMHIALPQVCQVYDTESTTTTPPKKWNLLASML